MTSAFASFRSLLAGPGMIVAPGAYDGITARLVEQAGFPMVYMTGAGTAAALGFPDYGLVTMSEMVANAAVIARSVAVPVLADADTGYGNELNVTRTVREFEASGAAGIHLEDQVSPKRCGHLAGKNVVEQDRFVSLIRAAVEARRSPDFVIVARTDAVATLGFAAGVGRANAALRAGADVAFVEALESMAQVAAVPKEVAGPCLLNVLPTGKTPVTDLSQAEDFGYKIAICPGLLLGAVVMAGDAVLTGLAETRQHPGGGGRGTVREMFNRFGAQEWDEIRERFA
ncbi:MAG: isocitrate lyase/PEP mutase family protein [Streptosporangiaceae bacterium]